MTRQNFYQGQSVTPEHLNALQDYADDGHAKMVSSILGYGVVNGFNVEVVEGHTVRVTSGLAFTSLGERLVLYEDKTVDFSQYIPDIGEKIIKLGIIVDYDQSNPVCDITGETVNTKWTPTVQFITGESLEEEVFELAEISLTTESITSIKSTSVYFATLKKLTQNNSVLVFDEDYATLQAQTINLVTGNLQVNGTEFMEVGNNDNGYYVKFENGLLICWGTITVTFSSGVYYKDVTWVLPHEYDITIPYFVGYAIAGGVTATRVAYYHGKGSSSHSARVVRSDSSTSTTYLDILTIGFWK